MNRLTWFLIISLIISSCSGNKSSEVKLHERLKGWDSYIYKNPSVTLDSLSKMHPQQFPAASAAYYNLLKTIATERMTGKVKDDEAINSALEYYRTTSDYYNLCRALLYRGASLFTISQGDTTAYFPIREAEIIFNNKKFDDNYLGASIYLYLGKINRLRSNHEEADKAFRTALDYCNTTGNLEDFQTIKLEMFWNAIAKRKYSEALESLISFGDVGPATPDLEYQLYYAMSSYHSAKRDFRLSIEYLKKMLDVKEREKIDVSSAKLYHSMASYFIRSNMPDSSLHYELLAIDAIEDSLSRDNHYYFKNVADILESKGNKAGALDYYKKAYISYRSAYSRITQNKILELEKKYDSNRQEAQLARLRTQKIFLINGIISLTLLLVIILLVSYISISKHKKRVVASASMQSNAEDELRRSWLVNELLKSSAGLFPQFMEDVNREAARSRKISKEVFDNLNETVDNIKTLSRQRIASITKSENFRALNSNIEYLTTLSDFEKIELMLIECEFSSQEIAELLSTTQASVRSVKTRIKEKIMAMEGLPFDPQTTFSIFK